MSGAVAELRGRSLSPDPLDSSPVTDLLYARLSPEDLDAVLARLDPTERLLVTTAADEVTRRRLTLSLMAYRGVRPAVDRVGLTRAMPPEGVHSMARGPLAVGGSMYYADLVVDALGAAGLKLAAGLAGLDFGCSSGRVVRVLAAAYPEIAWHGCDPNTDAVRWAGQHLAGIRFEVSPEYPPLPYEEGSFDFAFAISIWSHFSERAAVGWLTEMNRVIRPGGRLVLSTHGEQTIVHARDEWQYPIERLATIEHSLRRDGFRFDSVFGEAGDWGVANPDWGMAFLTPEWLLSKLTPEWSVAFFRPGRVEGNQDLYVVERR